MRYFKNIEQVSALEKQVSVNEHGEERSNEAVLASYNNFEQFLLVSVGNLSLTSAQAEKSHVRTTLFLVLRNFSSPLFHAM